MTEKTSANGGTVPRVGKAGVFQKQAGARDGAKDFCKCGDHFAGDLVLRCEAAKGNTPGTGAGRRDNLGDGISDGECEIGAGDAQDPFREETLFADGERGFVGYGVIERIDAAGGISVEPTDLNGCGLAKEEAQAAGEAIGVEIDQDVDLGFGHALGCGFVREVVKSVDTV